MAGPRHGENAWLWISAVVALGISAWCGALVYRAQHARHGFGALAESTRKDISALKVTPVKTAEVERGWVSSGFESSELVAPVGPRPCAAAAEALPFAQRAHAREAFLALDEPDVEARMRQLATLSERDPANLLVALIAGRELVENGRHRLAEEILWRSRNATDASRRIIEASRNPSNQLDLNDDDLATVIHLHHALGVAQLSSSAAHPPWVALKNVIGSVMPLSRRSTLGMVPGESAESKLTILAPGCSSPDGRSLSSYDLFNNLIVGYARGRFTDPVTRAGEFSRDEKQYPSAVRRLFVAQVSRERAAGWPNESRLWALSNADRVLDWHLPDNTQLAFNIVRVLDWWSDPARCPAAICTDRLRQELGRERDALLQVALTQRDVDPQQREAFAKGVIAMLSSSNIDPLSVEVRLAALREWLPQEQARVVDNFLAAQHARETLPRWAVRAGDAQQNPPWTSLGPQARAWREAALVDFASSVGAWAKSRSQDEKTKIAAALRGLLGTTPMPTSAAELRPGGIRRLWFGLSTAPWWWLVEAVFFGVVLWLLIVWVLLQVREYRLLRKSFYELELDYIDRMDVSQRR